MAFRRALDLLEKEQPVLPTPVRTVDHQRSSGDVEFGITPAKIDRLYSKARNRKLKATASPPEYAIPAEALAPLRQWCRDHPTAKVTVEFTRFLTDDRAQSLQLNEEDLLAEVAFTLLYHAQTTLLRRDQTKIAITVKTRGEQLLKILQFSNTSHLISILFDNPTPPSTTIGPIGTIGPIEIPESIMLTEPTHSSPEFGLPRPHVPPVHLYRPEPRLTQKIAAHTSTTTPIALLAKGSKLHPPSFEFRRELVPALFSWLRGHQATTLCPQENDLIYYRNLYEQGKKIPLVYGDEEMVAEQVQRGAFAFIVDAHAHSPDGTPLGPFEATIDLDPRQLEYDRMLDYVYQFSAFLSELRIASLLVHSGNNSFHFRVPIDATAIHMGYLIPRTESYPTFIRRRHGELAMTYLRDAIDILILAFNRRYPAMQMGCRIRKYSHKAKFPVFADNRTGIQMGARIPGSWHHKSDRFARLVDLQHLPTSEAELRYVTDAEYVQAHPAVLFRPEIPADGARANTLHLFEFTNDYYERTFNTITYREGVYD
jgi:hypothetical protein